jgi:hypothetical protein
VKKWRVYFNRRREAPQVWSVDEGDQTSEVNVQWVAFRSISFDRSSFAADIPEAEADTKPAAWFEFEATAIFSGGGVTFTGAPGILPALRVRALGDQLP